MPIVAKSVQPCLWFDTEAEAAAEHYVSIFPNAKLGSVSRYGKEGKEIHGKEAGSVMSVAFEIEDLKFLALNGGPLFKFTEAISFQILCDTQQDVDYFWSKLTDGGCEGQCGWLRDKFGLSWQVIPTALTQLLQHANAERAQRAMLKMRKFDIAALETAAA